MAPACAERSVITGALEKVDRQVRLNRVLDQLSIGICVVLGAVVLVEIVKLLVPVTPPPGVAIAAAGTLLVTAFLVWSEWGAGHLPRAAVVADSRADLHDEIKSAYWFMREGDASPWIDLLVRRAAASAARLDARKLVPTTIPTRMWTALGLTALLMFIMLLPIDGPLFAFGSSMLGPGGLTAEQESQFEDIRDLIEEAEALEEAAAVDENALSQEARERLEEALARLEREELSMEELLRELREAQNALEEGNLELSAMDEALEELAADLATSEEMSELAAALQNQDLAEAAELMRQLAEQLQNMPAAEAQDLMDSLQRAAQGDQPTMEELMEALREAAENMENNQMADAEQALEEAAEALEAMSQRMDAQEMMNQASQQMQAMQQQLGQQQMAQQQMSQQMMASDQQSGESQEGAMAMPSDEVQKSASGGESSDPSQEGGPAGHATSDPTGGEMQLGAPTTLDVQLEMEIIDEQTPEEEIEEVDPEDIFQEASRQQNSIIKYRSVRGPSRYAEGSALNVERIPWRYRNLVKRYFLAIKPRENQ